MSYKSGCKIEESSLGGYELTYFGHFATSEPSQTLYVRSLEDLRDIGYKIDRIVKAKLYDDSVTK
jgi:hypothetical protein